MQRYSVNWLDSEIFPDKNGIWVSHEDYKQLESENAELRQTINRLEENKK